MDMKDNPNYYFIERPYKSKYICADCRKVFKRKILADITKGRNIQEKEPKCPDCGGRTSWIGPKFRAPKSDNINAWNSINTMHDIGVLNFIGWANNHLDIPETQKALRIFLADLKSNYEQNIKRWTTTEYSPDNKNQIKLFADAIKRIDKHLKTK
jgi:DNA-directed RNA polymerase subunit RPC12/RpoP